MYKDTAIVLITKNEQLAIERVISDLLADVTGCKVLVVDDSTDMTPDLAKKAGAEVMRGPGRGFGPAFHLAISTPTQPFIVTIDADGTYPTNVIPQMIQLLRQGYDVVGTNRLQRLASGNMPLSNWLANRCFSSLASLRARQRLYDVHSGLRAYRRSVIHEIRWEFTYDAFPVDLLLVPAMAGYKVKELSINYKERIGDSSLDRWSSGRASLKRLLRSKKSILASGVASQFKDDLSNKRSFY